MIETLALKVRFLSVHQITLTWWGPTRSAAGRARERMAMLLAEGLVHRAVVNARPLLALERPVATWEPGAPAPEVWSIADRLQSRWTRPPKPTPIFYASYRAANQFGGVGGRLDHRLQATHDLHLAQLYLHLRTTEPRLADLWLNEDLRPKAGFRLKDPDVLLHVEEGRPPLVVEFGGRYDAKRVTEFHDFCSERNMPWQIW